MLSSSSRSQAVFEKATIEKATSILEEPNKLKFLQRTALIAALACLSLLVITLNSAPSQFYRTQSTNDVSMRVELHGRQPIKKDCANFYGSDWVLNPETAALVVCNTDSFRESQIEFVGFSQYSPNHGISYIETGSGSSVTLYSENNYQGLSYEIDPNSKIWLQKVPMPDRGGKAMWNDKVKSIYLQTHTGSIITQVEGPFASIPVCGDHCVLLYASDPFEEKHTTAVVLCGDAKKDMAWKFSYEKIQDAGYPLKFYSLGVSYVTIGSQTTLTMFSGPSFDGKHSYTFPKDGKNDKSYDLTKLQYPNEPHGWNDKPMSFILRY